MMFQPKCIVVLFALFALAQCDLPNYIQRCSKFDNDLNDCILKSTKKALPIILRGDEHLGIPSYIPMHLPQAMYESGEHFTLRLTNIVIHGIEHTTISDVKWNIENNTGQISYKFPAYNWIGDYVIRGNILGQDIGEGSVNITLVNGDATYKFKYMEVKKEEKENVKVIDSEVSYDVEKVLYQFDNLNDNAKGEKINKYFNTNWETINETLRPANSKIVNKEITKLFNKVFKHMANVFTS